MPRIADTNRARAIRAYFTSHYPPGTDPKNTRGDIQPRFALDNQAWYRTQAMLRNVEWPAEPTQAKDNPEPAVASSNEDDIFIPADLPDQAKEAFSRLLNRHARMTSELQTLASENSQLKSVAILLEKKNRQLKSITM